MKNRFCLNRNQGEARRPGEKGLEQKGRKACRKDQKAEKEKGGNWRKFSLAIKTFMRNSNQNLGKTQAPKESGNSGK